MICKIWENYKTLGSEHKLKKKRKEKKIRKINVQKFHNTETDHKQRNNSIEEEVVRKISISSKNL